MYIPQHYKQTNIAEIKDFLMQNSFGILINQVNGKPWATHIPLELETDENGIDNLVGHVSKANPQAEYFNKSSDVLCIFNGPHAYISSSWYKEEEVPTWNYVAVHIYGKLTISSEEDVMESLHRLVDKYEKNSKNPISLSNMSSETLRQVKGVIGFKISIDDIQATYKLSQTRTDDHTEIISELEETKSASACAIAQAMKNQKIKGK